MPRRDPLKPADIRGYWALILIILLLLVLAGNGVLRILRNSYYDRVAAESHRLAATYARSLTTSLEARDLINRQLEDRLRLSALIVAESDRNRTDAGLARLMRITGVDEIYGYSSDGVVTASGTGTYIGWRPEPGHPVEQFMNGNQPILVEEIRPDSENGVLYKYAYIRLQDGRFFQLGIRAENVAALLEDFETEHLIRSMQEEQYVTAACFLDTSSDGMTACPDDAALWDTLPDEAFAAARGGREYETLRDGLHLVLMPVRGEAGFAGSLLLGYDTTETERLLNRISGIGLGALLLIFLSMAGSVTLLYHRNRNLFRHGYLDPLTDLPNRLYYHRYATRALEQLGPSGVAVLLINCRNFKNINRTHGYPAGDRAIRALADALRPLQDDRHRLFHLTADQFVFLIRHPGTQQDLIGMCERVLRAVDRPLPDRRLDVRIGIAASDAALKDSGTAIRSATLAMEPLLGTDARGYAFFNEDMEMRLRREEHIAETLRQLLRQPDGAACHLEYQPILDLKNGGIYGLEALARLDDPELGRVPPDEFIAVAERTFLIVPLGRCLMEKACRFIRRLEEEGYGSVMVTVNVSVIQLLRDDFLDDLRRILKETGARAAQLGIELTESVFADDFELINERLYLLEQQGIRVAIDDFGTGYSTLAREKELHVSGLKIDKLFVDDIMTHEPDNVLVGDIISMAHRLKHGVVAEGVEYEQQRRYLIEHDCDLLQGYLFSRPVPEDQALELLHRHGASVPEA